MFHVIGFDVMLVLCWFVNPALLYLPSFNINVGFPNIC